MEPKVSIIIPFYNCPYVDQAIQSAVDQTYQNVEVIVVDDGSFIYRNKLEPFRKKIKLLRKENGGTASALNHGIKAASGEYVAWLSSDDYYMPGKIENQLTFMRKNNYDASFTNYACIDKNNIVTNPWTCPRFASIEDVYKTFFLYNAINGCTVLCKKNLLTKNGYFNTVFRYTQDYEMWYRLLTKGIHVHYFDEVLTHFRQHDQSGTSKHQLEMGHEINVIETYYRPLLAKYIVTQLGK